MRPSHASQSQSSTTAAPAALKGTLLLRQAQDQPPPQAPPPNDDEAAMLKYHIDVRERIHEGPFYTILNDGMKNGLKRRANDPAPTEASLFNPFTDNQTYTSKYLKVRRRIPKLDTRPYGE
jgi:DNA-directed RNA polymerase III subunit RPC7